MIVYVIIEYIGNDNVCIGNDNLVNVKVSLDAVVCTMCFYTLAVIVFSRSMYI